ncbi:hypothetical protein FOA52_001444 [Chlamydomonas sp. UWO 241]|nr:hypothetical protein FOA52_001444 [Chlamydomonas sp. UWO 241]
MSSPRRVFEEYSGRRKGIIKALTTDAERFFAQADPQRENLCLYAHPDGTWTVEAPPEEVPAEVPEPTLGINFCRDGMPRKDWLGLVAVHSDAWLMACTFYRAARLDAEERDVMFALVNRLPTVFEVVSGRVKQVAKPKPPAEEDDDDGDGDPCPQCGKLYSTNEFWIACDFCDTWYCGRCAKMTEAKATKVKSWKCPGCSGGA